MTNEPKASTVYWGRIDAMIAEVGAYDMGAEWFEANRYKYAALIDGNAQWETLYYTAKADARKEAQHLGKVYGVPVVFIS